MSQVQKQPLCLRYWFLGFIVILIFFFDLSISYLQFWDDFFSVWRPFLGFSLYLVACFLLFLQNFFLALIYQVNFPLLVFFFAWTLFIYCCGFDVLSFCFLTVLSGAVFLAFSFLFWSCWFDLINLLTHHVKYIFKC